MDAIRITHALRTVGLTLSAEFHEAVSSTSDRAREALQAGASEWLVVADSQTQGRGRLGRKWHDVPGAALLFSLALVPDLPRERWPLIGLAGGLSAVEAIQELTGIAARIKWPNDVVAPGPELRWVKVGGVLLEAYSEGAVLGMGVNVTAAPRLGEGTRGMPAGCLRDLGAPPPREVLLADILWRFLPRLGALREGRLAEVLEPVRRLDITQGQHVTLALGDGTVSGVVEGLDDSGALLLRTDAGLRSIRAGEVHLSPHLGTTEAGRS